MKNDRRAEKKTTEDIRKNKHRQLLAEGYSEMSEESLEIMKDFQELDRETLRYSKWGQRLVLSMRDCFGR
ncbi:MAG: hypothetical protein NTY34_00195 [Candidatus Omnitrophica bacterium]|nr:hypothetical protein [Candidatus Omnitrophota bacterium]